VDNINKLVGMLAESGTVATRDQAERIAIDVSGSVDAYISEILRTREELKSYKPLDPPMGGVSYKFIQDLG
jgi:hypothetical protein